MRVVLVATQTHPVAIGLRYLSSYLKSAGHDVRMVFLSSQHSAKGLDFTRPDFERLFQFCRESDLIGLSLMTSGYYLAAKLTQAIRDRKINVPVVWGGIHPTVAPDESLEIADAICMGEGEESTRLLLQRMSRGKDPTDIGGMGFRAGGWFGNSRNLINPVLPLDRPLEDYPFPDYDLKTHWILRKGEFVQARPELLRSALQRLRVQTTRGCPYSCTFCNNTVWQELYRGKGKWVRQRSNQSIIAEITSMRARFPTIRAVNIIDDLFLVRHEDVLEDFVARYTSQVNLPLELDAFPNTVTEAKVRILTRLPLHLISMGIQSGSPDTLQNVYHRPTTPERISECIDLFSKYGLRAEYHYIIANPYESEENVIASMRFIASHHKGPAVLRVFPLMLYPGSPLYKRARNDGIIGERHEDAYQPTFRWKRILARYTYLYLWLDIVLSLRNAGLPPHMAHRLIDIITNRLVRACLGHRWFTPIPLLARLGLHRLAKMLAKLKPESQRASRRKVPAAAAG